MQSLEHDTYLTAINRAQAIIEFDLDGNVITANKLFLQSFGYNLDEVTGQHHRIFCDQNYVNTDEYRNFWLNLSQGNYQTGEYKRYSKHGEVIWIHASYNPIFDDNGKPVKVVKFATDITSSKPTNVDFESRVKAIDRVQAVIEFNLDGTILSANDNFLEVTGYSLDEIVGEHHRMFCDAEFADSAEYQALWKNLAKGIFDSGEYRRITKTGDEIWINASYNPVIDAEGSVVKVVKFATDITEQKLKNADYESKIRAIDRVQAVIEFDLNGNVLTANDNFLNTLGYRLDEIVGRHHRQFCHEEYTKSDDYRDFWADLKRGDARAGLFERVAKDGRRIWIQANYNPILGPNGDPIKVVKFATDTTKEVMARNKLQTNVESISTSLGTMSQQISEETNKVATNAQNLGATTEEMSGCVEELSASIDSIAHNSKIADQQAIETREKAEIGVTAIEQSIESMDLINRSSEEIKDILMVISEIASQTNLLAFNAAIEAARAGEHGLGFSVVADEVRKLAERSSQATLNISKLINESTRRIERGSEISKEAGTAFQSIVAGVVNTANSISQITVAAEEQQAAARDVASAIEQVATSAETSAEATNVIASSTRDLAEQASELMTALVPAS